MIKSLTKEQENLMKVYADKWIKIGLDTSPCNKILAEDALNQSYKIVGLSEPKQIIWTTSPLAGLLIVNILKDEKLVKKILKDLNSKKNMDLGSSVGSSVWSSVESSVWSSVWSSVESSVLSSVGSSVLSRVRSSVESSVLSRVRSSVESSVWSSVWSSVGSSVWSSVGSSVLSRVRSSVESSVWSSVENQPTLQSIINEAIYGQHDISWLSFHDYFREVCKLVKETEKLVPLIDLAKHSNWVYPYKNIAIISEKPVRIKMENNKLHCTNGPAVLYKDGFSVYSINGEIITGEKLEKIKHQEQFNNKMDTILIGENL